jgi:hypothetical protein
MHVIRLLAAACIAGANFALAADRAAEGATCSQANNRLDVKTGNFLSDCDARTFCNAQGVCQAKGCRKDDVSLGRVVHEWLLTCSCSIHSVTTV